MAQTKPAKRKSTYFLAKLKRDCVRRQYLEASRDPRFLADVDEVEKTFRLADAESARMIQ